MTRFRSALGVEGGLVAVEGRGRQLVVDLGQHAVHFDVAVVIDVDLGDRPGGEGADGDGANRLDRAGRVDDGFDAAAQRPLRSGIWGRPAASTSN